MSIIGSEKSKSKRGATKLVVPDYLVREIIDGDRWFYKGYQDVLSGLKTFEEIMACSGYQSILVNYINNKLWNHLEEEPYWVMSNEIGNNLSKKSKAAYDVAVFDEAALPAHRIGAHYVNVPPKLVIEVDVKIETESKTPGDIAWQIKTNKLHEFGVEMVIWFFTTSQRVLIARLNQDWIFGDWHRDIEIWDGLKINVGQYLAKRGIQPIDKPNES
jgi:Putative restriction endonuclease